MKARLGIVLLLLFLSRSIGAGDIHLASPVAPDSHGGDVAYPDAKLRSIEEITRFDVDGRPLVLSPDGMWMAGIGLDGESFCVWELEDQEETCVGESLDIQEETIIWAPDSSAVAFSLDAARMMIDSDVYVFELGEGELNDITDDGIEGSLSRTDSKSPVGAEALVDIYPAWSPDGSQLIFARSVWGTDGAADLATTIFAISRSGGEAESILTVSDEEGFVVYSPMHWLSTGDIVYSRLHADPNDPDNGVWLFDTGGDSSQIIRGDADAVIPTPVVASVSVDERVLSVVSLSRRDHYPPSSDEDVFFLHDLTTNESHPLFVPKGLEFGGFVVAPAQFSPDADEAIYVVRDLGGETEYLLAIANSDGALVATLPVAGPLGGLVLSSGLLWSEVGTFLIPGIGDEGDTGVVLGLDGISEPIPTPQADCGCIDPAEDDRND